MIKYVELLQQIIFQLMKSDPLQAGQLHLGCLCWCVWWRPKSLLQMNWKTRYSLCVTVRSFQKIVDVPHVKRCATIKLKTMCMNIKWSEKSVRKENSKSYEFLDDIPVNLSSATCHGIWAEHRVWKMEKASFLPLFGCKCSQPERYDTKKNSLTLSSGVVSYQKGMCKYNIK